MAGTWVNRDDLAEAKSDSWLDTAKASTDVFVDSLKSRFGYGNEPKTVAIAEPPPMDIRLPTAEEWHAAAPWREKPVQTPSGTPAAMPTAPRTVDATITAGPRPGQSLQPGESVGSVTLGPPPAPGSRQAHARTMAQKYGLDEGIFDRQLMQESGYRDDAVSSAGARGPGQFMPETGNAVARQMGVTPEQFWASPELQIEGAAFHMRDLLQRNNGNYRMALAAYNAGQGNVDKYGEGVFGDDFAAGQTRDYVNIILGPGASSGRVAPAPAAPMPSSPAQPQSGQKLRVRDQWGNEFEITEDALRRRPGGSKDLTVIGPVAMNAGAGSPQPAPAPSPQAAAGVPPTSGGPELPPRLAQAFKSANGRDPSPEEVTELRQAFGMMA